MFALPEAAVLSASARGFLRRNGMVMKKTYLFGAIWAVLVGVVVFVALTFALRGCSFEARNQNTYTTTMEVADFSAISVAMPAEVTYTVGPQCSVWWRPMRRLCSGWMCMSMPPPAPSR